MPGGHPEYPYSFLTMEKRADTHSAMPPIVCIHLHRSVLPVVESATAATGLTRSATVAAMAHLWHRAKAEDKRAAVELARATIRPGRPRKDRP